MSLEFQAFPLQQICYIKTARLNSVYRINSSGFYFHHLTMCSSHHKTQHPNIRTQTSNCHTFKPMSFVSECSEVVPWLIVSQLNMVLVFWFCIHTAFHDFFNQASYIKYEANLTSNTDQSPFCYVCMWAEQLSVLAVSENLRPYTSLINEDCITQNSARHT
jgi:hypothetical protein